MTKIDQIETMILDIPTIRGHVLSMATMRTQTAVLVRIKYSDGSEGIGEGTTIGGLSYGAESPEGIQSAIDTYITPLLLGREADNVNGAIQLIDKLVKGNRIAKTAVEIALWDGLGKRLGVPVSQLFGGAVHRKLPVAWTLASGNSDTDIAEAQEMIETRRHKGVLHRSTATRNAPNPRRNSGGTFKTWTAESGHPVKNPDANLGFCFLIFEGSRL